MYEGKVIIYNSNVDMGPIHSMKVKKTKSVRSEYNWYCLIL